jgi:hypothetical protein
MPKVDVGKEWHSKLRDTTKYHNNTKCTVGDNIEPENLVKNSKGSGLTLCDQCAGLNREGK